MILWPSAIRHGLSCWQTCDDRPTFMMEPMPPSDGRCIPCPDFKVTRRASRSRVRRVPSRRARTRARTGSRERSPRYRTTVEAWTDPDRADAALARIARRIAEPTPLSRRELACVFLTSHGVSRERAALMLSVSPHTVAEHSQRAQAKLGAATPAHAAATALRLGLID
jgi:DNA-binding CsgD family transcriptional regulator